MKVTIRNFTDHQVITYLVDDYRFVRMVNFALNRDCYPEKWSTLIEFNAPNGRNAVITTGTNLFIYSSEDALFKEIKNEFLPYHKTPLSVLRKYNISLTKEDIKVFSDYLKSNIDAVVVE